MPHAAWHSANESGKRAVHSHASMILYVSNYAPCCLITETGLPKPRMCVQCALHHPICCKKSKHIFSRLFSSCTCACWCPAWWARTIQIPNPRHRHTHKHTPTFCKLAMGTPPQCWDCLHLFAYYLSQTNLTQCASWRGMMSTKDRNMIEICGCSAMRHFRTC